GAGFNQPPVSRLIHSDTRRGEHREPQLDARECDRQRASPPQRRSRSLISTVLCVLGASVTETSGSSTRASTRIDIHPEQQQWAQKSQDRKAPGSFVFGRRFTR